ncbi:MAG: glycosyltransferase family 4 protein [Betaproteobacteria bacterium]
MTNSSLRSSRLVMLGAATETRSSIAAVVNAYRTHGLFKRWPVDFIATHCDGTAGQNAALAIRALRDLGMKIGEHRGVAMHLHTAPGWHFRRDAVYMSAAAAMRCPLLLQLHGAGFEAYYDGAADAERLAIRFFLRRAACVAVPSESMRTWVRGIVRAANVHVVPHPVGFSEQPAIEERPNVILFLGRLDASKGILDLLEAVAGVRATVPDVRLACAGDGNRIGVARYAERLGIADAVKFTGWVGPSGKRSLLETAAVFALPSYDEALPMSLLEAMAAGVPAVVTPVGGIPEIVVDGVSGLIVAPGDKAGLQRALQKLLIERRLGARLGATARESARARFSPERALPVLEELYRTLGVRADSPESRDGGWRDLRKAA